MIIALEIFAGMALIGLAGYVLGKERGIEEATEMAFRDMQERNNN